MVKDVFCTKSFIFNLLLSHLGLAISTRYECITTYEGLRVYQDFCFIG